MLPAAQRGGRRVAAVPVLLASADPVLRAALRAALERDGYRLLEAADADACIDRCRRRAPALIVVDPSLPESRVRTSREPAPPAGRRGGMLAERMRAVGCGEVPLLVLSPGDDAPAALLPHAGVLRQRVVRRLGDLHRGGVTGLHDAVTGLSGRALFVNRCSAALTRARRSGRALALLQIAADVAPDDAAALCRCGERLTAALRENDTVCRFAGTIFAALLEDLTASHDVARIAAKLLDRLAQPLPEPGVAANIGIALFPGHGDAVAALLARAASALERAARRGYGRYRFFTDPQHGRALERSLLGDKLSRALARDEITLYYQPRFQIDGERRRVSGVEALARWHHPELGLIAAGEFMPLAEEVGLAAAFGDWTLRSACRQAALWQRQGRRLPVAINLSPSQLRQPGLAAMVRTTLADAGLDPRLLELELPEAALADAGAGVGATLTALRELGVGLTLDDFGSGACSLTRLRELPLSALNLDRALTRDVPAADAADVVRAALATADCFALPLVAKGVERAPQQAFLTAHGCTRLQGYYLAVPGPADALPLH